jgi:hypothetical protein
LQEEIVMLMIPSASQHFIPGQAEDQESELKQVSRC